MDRDNHSTLLDRGAPEPRTRLLLDWHPEGKVEEVPDPYYGGIDGFAHMYDLIEAACDRLLDELHRDVGNR